MRKGLGRGLDALISSANALENARDSVLEVKINDVEPNADQPRKVFDQERLQALAESIKEHGVVQPIIVRQDGSRYVIVAGERRWRAAKLAGLKTIPVVVKELSSRQVMEIALIENLQREDLNPIEEAEAYQKLMDEYSMTQEEVAKLVGKSRAAIANSVRLLTLAKEIREMLVDGRLTSGHARTLVAIEDENRQKELADLFVKKGLNVREAEKLAAQEAKRAAKKVRPKKEDLEMTQLVEDLRTLFGTKIDLQRGKDKGKIVIEYYSKEEFDRIIDLLLNVGK
ncbi:MAG TPA: ParB/RepB/Spo0J family partition protein [Thermoclostridium caenicola]|uniref:ParB/RepB/Spo0J family partition protein n=1 Tax=Thermoclostridium caenicola TaxID=659425 RepID=UPI002B63BF45|nr:ParB/RepB/Spo0J family partition protein [Thermoclostridium caenicola]HOK43471.1 ParB/RepB/Spo0J family partition protein [Thermoclostridium caenicola]HOL84255.1 ParB/RepB/Spo0J family partition protein [Thermoclostridium caenicola]HPO76445.1 ParB/RepB/Spo0J family partition protein [Thermoclostridium caenicola]